MNPSALTGARKHLISQLIFFDEQFISFLDHYFSDPFAREKAQVEKLLRRYAEKLEQVLATDDEKLMNALKSVVLIGSKVKVYFEEDGSEESFTVVYPTEIDPDSNRISCLSPVGRQLLLANADSAVELETPVGLQQVQIRGIEYAYIGGFEQL